MPNFLHLYSTTDRHMLEISERIRDLKEQSGNVVALREIKDIRDLDLASYDKIVIGDSIRYGKHHRDVYHFIEQNLNLLQSKLNAFFSVNTVARKPKKRQPDTNPYL